MHILLFDITKLQEGKFKSKQNRQKNISQTLDTLPTLAA